MGDPQISQADIEQIQRNMRALMLLVRRLPQKVQRPKASAKSSRDLKTLKVYIYEQKVPKDGHGPVVIIDENRDLADAQFLNRFQKKWPNSSAVVARDLLKNAKVTEKSVCPSIVLDHHGI